MNTPSTPFAISIEDVRRAADVIQGQVVRTPAVHAPSLTALTGTDIYLKLENLQLTSSFKVRGACNRLAALDAEARAAGVVAASAGNHAQGVAYHAGRMDIPATIFMPLGTPFNKTGRTESLGAEVVLAGEDFQACQAAALAHASEIGMTFIPPFDDPYVMAGQGTATLEFLEDIQDLEALVVPIGGGGLMAGAAITARAVKPDIRLVGVQSEYYASIAAHETGGLPPIGGQTLAEGIAVKSPGRLTFPVIDALVDEVIAIPEQRIEESVQALVEQERIVAEGAAAAALAAVRMHPQVFAGHKTGLMICGGNIDSRLLASILMRGLARDGRMVRLRIDIPDLPGTLAKVSGLIGGAGGNIVEVYHQRLFHDVPVKHTELHVVVETRDPEHVNRVMKALQDAGFPCRPLEATES